MGTSRKLTWFMSNAEKVEDTIRNLQTCILEELETEFPGCVKGGKT